MENISRAKMRRRLKTEKKAKTVTYNLTKERLDLMVKERIEAEIQKVKEEATAEAVNTAMVLLLALPIEVLMDFYWTKSYVDRLPGFVDHILDYYNRWEEGEFTLEELREDIWKYAGIRLEGGVEDAEN